MREDKISGLQSLEVHESLLIRLMIRIGKAKKTGLQTADPNLQMKLAYGSDFYV